MTNEEKTALESGIRAWYQRIREENVAAGNLNPESDALAEMMFHVGRIAEGAAEEDDVTAEQSDRMLRAASLVTKFFFERKFGVSIDEAIREQAEKKKENLNA